MNNVEQLAAQHAPQHLPELKTYRSEIAKIREVVNAVWTKEPVPIGLAPVVKVMLNKGHLRFSERAQRYMFTPEGHKFARMMRRIG